MRVFGTRSQFQPLSFSMKWGDEGYAMEELVAEIGKAFLCADFSITSETMVDYSAYVMPYDKVSGSPCLSAGLIDCMVFGGFRVFNLYWGIHLTGVATTCSVCGYGRLPA